MRRCLRLLWIYGLCVLLSGCGNKDKALKKGMVSFPDVVKFNKIFEKRSQKIASHGGLGDGLGWESRGIIHDRYVFYMYFDVSIGKASLPRRTSMPVFWLKEWESLSYDSGMGMYSSQVSQVGKLDYNQWQDISSPDDIFRILKIVPKKGQPIAGLEDLINVW